MSMATGELVADVMAGDRRSLAKALTLIENGSSDDVRELLNGFEDSDRVSWTIGITGPPGAGKSTLTNAVVTGLRTSGKRVAVLAVDPSSPYSGGALLGDRIRMRSHQVDPDVYVRSMASRGHLGGLSLAAASASRLLGAAGFDYVILETVGVGQSEVEIASTADVTLLVLTPGAGDAVQAAKAGVMEIADIFVINKADHDGATRLESDIRSMLRAAPYREGSWVPRIVRTVASKEEGIDKLLAVVLTQRAHLESTGQFAERRRGQALHHVREAALALVSQRVDRWLRQQPEEAAALLDRVNTFELPPAAAAVAVLAGLQDDASTENPKLSIKW